MRKMACFLALWLVPVSAACALTGSGSPKPIRHAVTRPRAIHRDLRPAYLHSLIPSAAKSDPNKSLKPLTGKKLAHMSGPAKSNHGVLQKLGIETVGGPPGLGTTRPNEWSGLQTTIPEGVPGRVQGITVKHF